MNGRCDFCPRPGILRRCGCVHEHIVGVWVCAEKHDDFLNGEIGCRMCQEGSCPHFCALSRAVVEAVGPTREDTK